MEDQPRVFTKSKNTGSKSDRRWVTFMNAIATVASFHSLCDTTAVAILSPEPEPTTGCVDILVSCACENEGAVGDLERDLTILLDHIRPFELLRLPSPNDDRMGPESTTYYETWSKLMEHVFAFARTKVARVVQGERCGEVIAALGSSIDERIQNGDTEGDGGEGDSEGQEPGEEEQADAASLSDDSGDSAILRIHDCLVRLVTLSDNEVYFYEALEIVELLKEQKVQDLIEQAAPGSCTFLRDDVASLANAVSNIVWLALDYRRITKGQPLPAWNLQVVPAQPARKFEAELTDELLGTFLNTLACISLPQHEFSPRARANMLIRLRKRHDMNSQLFPAHVPDSPNRDDGPTVHSHCEVALICHLIKRNDRSRAKDYIGLSAPSCGACHLFLEAVNEHYCMCLRFDRWRRPFALPWNSPEMDEDFEVVFLKHLEDEVEPLLSDFAEDGLCGDLSGEITSDLIEEAMEMARNFHF